MIPARVRLVLSPFFFAFVAVALCGATTPDSRLVNLSSRAVVGTGANVLIAGFVIGGHQPKDVLIRAVGPTLAKFNVPGVLDRPRLSVFDSAGHLIASNTGWDVALTPVFAQLGATPLATNSGDAAARMTLTPGAYSVQVSGADTPTGAALVEVYEVDEASRLFDLSTRAQVAPGDGLLISGLVVTGSSTRRLLVRASGPALRALGVAEALADPTVTMLDAAGAVVATNDNWDETAYSSQLDAAMIASGAKPFPAGSKDAALLIDVSPGAYSVQVKSADGSTGVALVEVFDVTAINPAAVTPGRVNTGAPRLGGSPVPVTQPVASGGYSASQLSWAWSDVDARLGATFEQLHSGAADDRPTIPGRISQAPPASCYVRIKPYELGTAPAADSDYWSDSGQVAYIPDLPATDPGLDRIQTFAYYNKVFAISPRLDWASGTPHPDPQTREAHYATLNGAAPMQPVALVRNDAMEQNEALVIYRDGLFAVAGTQTSRAGSERPYPGFKFPPNKIPRAVAVTTSNEFALVAVWDTDRHVGQLAVVALEGKYIPAHTWPYMVLPNQGSWSDFKLLGYVDLPMAAPDAVAAASNGLWAGPSSTNGLDLGQIPLSNDGYRQLVYNGDWRAAIAVGGYAIVSSREDGKVAIVDLKPLFAYARDSWLSSSTNFQATLAARGAAPDQFPQTFAVNPSIAPVVVWQADATAPTAVLAGQKLDRWSPDRFKAYVATADGMVHIIDTSPLMQRNAWEVRGTLGEIGTVAVGRNPVSLAFARHGAPGTVPLIPNDSSGGQRAPDSLNNLFYVACRGDREIDAVVTWQGAGAVYERIRDSRLGDPVAVSVARRGPILTVADFRGKKLLSYRIGTLKDLRNNVSYAPVDPTYDYEFAGALSLGGSPFRVNSTNVN